MDNSISFDAVTIAEYTAIAASWVLLCHGRKLLQERKLQPLIELLVIVLFHILLYWLLFGAVQNSPYADFWILVECLLMGFLLGIYLLICYQANQKVRLMVGSAMFAGTCCIVSIAGQCSLLLSAYIDASALEGAVRCGITLTLIPLAFFLDCFQFSEFQAVPSSGIALLLAGNLTILALIVLNALWFQVDVRFTIFLTVAHCCVLLMILMAIWSMYTMCKEQDEVITLQTEKQRLSRERELTQMTESTLDDLRSIRHDLKNQYAYMQILLDEHRDEDLRSYFIQVSEQLPEQLSYVDCGNRDMNNILNMEFSKARRGHIPVEHQLVVPPVLPIGTDDLCGILANLMDNAIEECQRLQGKGIAKAGIQLKIYPQKSYLYILCRNDTDKTVLERQGDGLRTTKGNTDLHGYGTRIVSRLARKHNGAAAFTLKDGCFVAKVMLDMEANEHEAEHRAV
ncbi:MAG: GHKL domain-containing protein [Clostridiales bacterium]|nr:GHKL domain-containing protein [Clostridiales bacterium]MCC8099972.1 GHKL domain-containing protein [Clostridiales bacterium]